MNQELDRRPNWAPWAIASLVMVIVAMFAYGAGQHEAAAGAVGREHWHWGFPGIFGFFLLFWVFGVFRRAWWGWGCGWGYGPRRYRRYAPGDDYDEWREWHRREHEKMGQSRGADPVA
jgi:hypothetical protein